MAVYPLVNRFPFASATAAIVWRPGGSSPRTTNVALRSAPYSGSVTVRVSESARRPAGRRSVTRTSLGAVAADRSSTRTCLTSGVRAGTYSTARSRVTDTSGTYAMGRLTSPRTGSAKRYTTGTSTVNSGPEAVPSPAAGPTLTVTTRPPLVTISDSTTLEAANTSPSLGARSHAGPSGLESALTHA